MLHKDMRRAERRWRSRCVFMRRLKNDWATHGWNWNWLSATRISPSRRDGSACSLWAGTTLCNCFWDPGFGGMGRFKDTPHPRCGYECRSEWSHGLESRPIQEWRELARSLGDEGREGWSRGRRTPDRMILVRQTCACGFLMKKFLKPVSEIRWSDKRSEENCPSCERRFGPRRKVRMPA